jgi:flagellin
MISIHSNISENKYLNTLGVATSFSNQAIHRMSTGKKINLSDDNVAGFLMKSNIAGEVAGKAQGLNNANLAISALKTMEGASDSIINLLIRSKELATEALNDGYTLQQRTELNREWVGHVDEIRRISATTEWNDSNLLAASQTLNARVDSNTTVSGQTKDWAVNNANAGTGALGGNTFESSVACPLCGGDDLQHNFRRDDGSARECVKITAAKIESALQSAVDENTTISSYVNVLEVTTQTLSEDVQNLKNSLGKIEDADYAIETTTLAKNKIIAEASIALLAQGDPDHTLIAMLLE